MVPSSGAITEPTGINALPKLQPSNKTFQGNEAGKYEKYHVCFVD